MTTSTGEIGLRAGRRPLAATPERRAGQEFQRARRHSRVVRILKIGLPLVGALLVLVGIGIAMVARSLPGDLSVARTSIENGRLVMQDPRLTGTDSSDRPYSMVAERAIQTLTGTGVDLEGVRAEVAIDDTTTATISAAGGHYEMRSEELRLFDNIAVDTTSGIAIRLAEAAIDMPASRMVGTGPVTISTPGQRLESGSVVIEDGGSRLHFGDRVKLTLLPNAETGDNTGE